MADDIEDRLIVIDVGHYRGGSIGQDEDGYQWGNAGARDGEDKIIGGRFSEYEFIPNNTE